MRQENALSKKTFILLGALIFAMALSCKYSRDDHPALYRTYFNKLKEKKDLADRKATLDELEKIMHKTVAGDGDKVQFYNYKAATYQAEKKFDLAFQYIDSILFIANEREGETRFKEIKTSAFLQKSDCYSAMKNYDVAMKYLLEAKTTLGTNLGDLCKYAGFNERTAELFYVQEQYIAAINYYKKAIQDESACTKDSAIMFVNIQRFYDDIGLSYAGAGLNDSAALFFQTTLDYLSLNEHKYPEKKDYIAMARAVVYSNIAKIKRKQGLYDQAENLNIVSIKDTSDIYSKFTANTTFELADLYIELNKLNEAADLLKKLDTYIHKQGNDDTNEESERWNLAMEKLWSKKGDTAQAFVYGTRYLAIRDSLDLLDKSNINRDLGRELENKEQTAFNQVLEKENAFKAFQLVIVVLLSLLVIITILFIWYNLRRKAKHVKLLQKLNGEIKDKNNELINVHALLEKGQLDNSRITKAIAYDLKQSITRISITAQVLLKTVSSDDLREVLELIKTACDNSITLINDLIQEKEWFDKNKKEKVDMQIILQYCVNLLQAKAEEKNQRLYVQGDEVILPVNRQKIWRVISNILNNAIKFSPENTVINVRLEKKESTVLLSVKDQGIGIPDELKDKIFMLHPEASRAGTAGEESYGLGLSISRKIVEEHDGKLWFESEEGQGCTFFVELPVND